MPLAFASLLTGLVMPLGTKWGLFRHYWVLISLLLPIIATVVLLGATQTISYFAEVAADLGRFCSSGFIQAGLGRKVLLIILSGPLIFRS